jgi:hypothetical protein
MYSRGLSPGNLHNSMLVGIQAFLTNCLRSLMLVYGEVRDSRLSVEEVYERTLVEERYRGEVQWVIFRIRRIKKLRFSLNHEDRKV